MLLDAPKGLKYWKEDGTGIIDNAPKWAKEEYLEYMKIMRSNPEKPIKNKQQS